MMFKPRSGQSEATDYKQGKMGITAVPGSGKTHTLSLLAAKLIASEFLGDDQEILIVTLVNSAVNNFAARISYFLDEMGLIPGVGYRVRTLHGLAHDIVREAPHLACLDNHFSVADERTTTDILSLASVNWVRMNKDVISNFSEEGYQPSDLNKFWGQICQSISRSSIKLAKDYQLSPKELRHLYSQSNIHNAFVDMSINIFNDYDRALHDRGSVDFDDLVRLAYLSLNNNPDYLERLQNRWPFILEDEAQDSSLIQEKMLRLLSSKQNNWVRVGDPNQAIFETFTTANPELLRKFVKEDNVTSIDLPHSGRSTQSIIDLANHLVQWTKSRHPVGLLRNALDEPLIKPTPSGDPQPNPIDKPEMLVLYEKALDPAEELLIIAKSASKWISENPDKTVAILVPRNYRGSEIVEHLTELDAPVIELLSSSKSTRDTAAILLDLIKFYTYPTIRRNLSSAFMRVASVLYDSDENEGAFKKIKKLINKSAFPEYAFTQADGIDKFLVNGNLNNNERMISHSVFQKLNDWQKSLLLPIDEMIITVGADLFSDAADLAITHKISMVLKQALNYYPDWQLPEFCDELEAIARNKYRMYGFSNEDRGFDPDTHKGEIVVSTIHKAKGLEWDRVYLASVNNYNFPSASENDTYFSEKWFVKGQRNIEAETVQFLETIIRGSKVDSEFIDQATKKARIDFCAERLRLLYVGITRAREELIITWNTGKRKDRTEAIPLQALRNY